MKNNLKKIVLTLTIIAGMVACKDKAKEAKTSEAEAAAEMLTLLLLNGKELNQQELIMEP